MEDINKAKEDSKEDFTTKAKDTMTTEEVDTKAEVSKTKVVDLEEAEATSIQMISTSNNHLVLLVTAAPLQLARQDSSPTGIVIILKTHIRIRIRTLTSVVQTKDGTDN